MNDKPVLLSNTQTYKIRIKVIREVLDYDFPQAKKTWEALMEAGMDAENLTSNALSKGHGYIVEETEFPPSIKFQQDLEKILEDYRYSEDMLMGYKITLDTNHQLPFTSNPKLKDLVLRSQSITLREANESKVVDMTVIVRRKLPELQSLTLKDNFED